MSEEIPAKQPASTEAPEVEAHGVLGLQKLKTAKGYSPIETFSCSSCGAMSC